MFLYFRPDQKQMTGEDAQTSGACGGGQGNSLYMSIWLVKYSSRWER